MSKKHIVISLIFLCAIIVTVWSNIVYHPSRDTERMYADRHLDHFRESWGKVYFYQYDLLEGFGWYSKEKTKIDKIDADEFTIISRNVGRTNDTVYYKAVPLDVEKEYVAEFQAVTTDDQYTNYYFYSGDKAWVILPDYSYLKNKYGKCVGGGTQYINAGESPYNYKAQVIMFDIDPPEYTQEKVFSGYVKSEDAFRGIVPASIHFLITDTQVYANGLLIENANPNQNEWKNWSQQCFDGEFKK